MQLLDDSYAHELRAALEAFAAREPAAGYLLLEALALDDWQIAMLTAFGGGVLLVAERPGHPEIRAAAPTAREAGVELYRQALAVRGTQAERLDACA